MKSPELYCYNKYYELIEPILLADDCCSIVAQPHAGKSRILKEFCKRTNRNIAFIHIEDIEKLKALKVIPDIVAIQEIKLTDKLQDLEPFTELEKIRFESPKKFSIVYFFKLDPRLSPIFSKLRTVSTNVITLVPDKKYFNFLITQNEKRYDLEIDAKLKEKIYTISGANPLIVKQAVLNILNKEPYTANLELTAQNILDQYNHFELNVIKKGLKGSTKELITLQKTGILEGQNFKSIILEEAYQSRETKYRLVLRGGKVFVNKVEVSSEFTETERNILNYLEKNSFISRIMISQLISGKSVAVEVTEASVDKIMSRIRRKLEILKVTDLIKTYKGKGYYVDYNYWL